MVRRSRARRPGARLLRVGGMSDRFFASTLDGANGLVRYLVGDYIGAASAGEDWGIDDAAGAGRVPHREKGARELMS